MADYAMLPRLLRRLPEFEARVTFYNCDIPLPQYYLSCRALFPFGQCLVEHDGRTIASIRACETNEALDYPIPPLRLLELQLTENPLIPLQRGNTLLLTREGQSHELTTHDPVELLRQLNAFLTREDPDLILTDDGDTAIFPRLGPDDGVDVAQYQALLLDAALELLAPFGYDGLRVRQAMRLSENLGLRPPPPGSRVG